MDINGIDFTALEGEQNAEFEINANGELTVTQNAEVETDQPGVSGTATIVSKSVWVKK